MGRANIDALFYPEIAAGGFTRVDGSVEFYTRVNALLEPQMVVVDLGAGRGSFTEGASRYRRELLTLKGKVAKVVGIDVDPAVMEHPALDEAIVYDGRNTPLPDSSVDLVVSDWTFEHIAEPDVFAAEIARIIKPGGWLCARTPHLYSALVVASTLVPNRRHSGVLSKAQPHRTDRDIFPTTYRLNTTGALRRHFPRSAWEHHSYTWSPEPGYHFGNPVLYGLLQLYQYVKKPLLGGECLFVFMQRKSQAGAQ